MAVTAGLALLWGSSAVAVYVFLAAHRSGIARQAVNPDQPGAHVNPALARLPGTMYMVQNGALYRLQQGKFTAVLPSNGWTQPAALPGGQGLILVKRDPSGYSDLYRVDAAGHAQPLTSDQGHGAVPGTDPGFQVVTQYWAMYPRVSADGRQLYFATDRYKHARCCPYDVTMRLAQMPIAGGTPRFWTVDAVTQTDSHTADGDYAGGDVEPLPLASGALLFVRYAYVGSDIGSQVMLLKQARATPSALTAAGDHCAEPALSPDGSKLAMICSYGKQATSLEVAAFDGSSLGPRQVIVSGLQVAQPVWSPDGSRLIYLAPVGVSGHFQIWSTGVPAALPTPTPLRNGGSRSRTPTPSPVAATGTPSPGFLAPPVQLTDNLDFDATSAIAWTG